MSSIRKASIAVLENLPDNSSLEEIMYQINLVAQVTEGLKDAKKGETISTKEILRKVSE